jgi:hypothetical protein
VASKFAVEKGANFVRYVILGVILLTVANTFGLVDIQDFFARYIK